MKMYKMHVDMGLLLPRLRKFRLGDYNAITAIVFAEADNPDEAVGKAWDQLVKMVMKQDDSNDTVMLLRELKHDFAVKKAYVP